MPINEKEHSFKEGLQIYVLREKKKKTTKNICSVRIAGRLFGHYKNIKIHFHVHLSIFSFGTGDNRRTASKTEL